MEKKQNRLASAISPYLLQHAENPVDWWPWCEEAFEKARREDKPVFLSVGYSSCHWCHVMERESFESEEVARILNEGFVSIKVDREERPDVDDVYMRVTQMMTGQGGWPMTVFMTPDRRPFFAGTYFPGEPRYGMPSFKRVLEEVLRAWRARREEVERSATEIARAVAQSAEGGGAAAAAAAPPPGVTIDASLVRAAAAAHERRFDEAHGGFGGAPKFPPHHALRLFVAERERAGPRAFRMAIFTLERMAAGGMYDQIGGGFHRYSVTEDWLVPHFEKMLYDNGMLARAYASAFEATGRAEFRRVAEGIFGWVAREMTSPEGGFYSALDADSEGVEGKYYVWTPAEVEAALGAELARAFCAAYDITEEGNWEGKSIPRLRAPPPDDPRIEEARARLLAARAQRVPPARDDKVIVAWNGLMIGGYARGYAAFGDERYRAAAERAATFILENMRAPGGGGRLLRIWRRGRADVPAFLEDYVLFGDGLLDLYDATGERRWLETAREIADRAIEDFADRARGGFFATSDLHERLLFREKDPFDGATPAPNGVAARLLARLARAGAGERYAREADRTIRAFAGALARGAIAMLTLLEAIAIRGEVGPAEVAAPEPEAPVAVAVELCGAGPLRPGEEAEVAVRIRIAPGFHVSARRAEEAGAAAEAAGAAEGAAPAPLRVEPLDSAVPVVWGAAVYPGAREWPAPFAKRSLFAYEGEIEVRLPLRVAPGARAGKGALRVAVEWQACDERRCLAPARRELEVPVDVAAA